MILYKKGFEEFIEKIIKIQKLGVNISIYMENIKANSINLYIANNISRGTYIIKHPGIANTTWRVIEGYRICGFFSTQKYKIEGERVRELYGVDDDEIESDYTIEELELKALPRTAKLVADVLEERIVERIDSEGLEEGSYDIFWQSEMIGTLTR